MSATTLQEIPLRRIDGSETRLGEFRGSVLLVVNVASQCGLTPQYAGLQDLYERYRDRNFAVLGFPANQFGAQEPGNAEEIASFCSLTYDVSFPLMAKIDVNGPAAHPLYAWLKHETKGLLGSEGVKWNFTKFLVSRDGQVKGRFGPATEPKAIEAAIEAVL